MSSGHDRVTTVCHGSYLMAIRTVPGNAVRRRTSAYLNSRFDEHHCGIKGRIRCRRAFKGHDPACRFRRERDGLGDLLRYPGSPNQIVSASSCRARFAQVPRIALDIMASG